MYTVLGSAKGKGSIFESEINSCADEKGIRGTDSLYDDLEYRWGNRKK